MDRKNINKSAAQAHRSNDERPTATKKKKTKNNKSGSTLLKLQEDWARRRGERVAGGESRKLKLKQAENSNLFTL